MNEDYEERIVDALPDKFWIVQRADGKNVSKAFYRHYQIESAKNEAARLCQQERTKFYVLEVVSFVQPETPPVKWTEV